MICISDNWIVNILENALTDWNGKLSEIWALLTQTPQSFKGGDIWTMITGIHNAMVGIGYGLLESIPLWLVALLGSLFITVMSFILLLTVYGRFFRLYMFTALAPLPLASFAGEGTAASGKAFLKNYIGVCMEGAVIVLACLIYSAFLSSSTPAADASLPAVTMAWQYIGQLIFNMLILTGLVKGADRVVKEMLGL